MTFVWFVISLEIKKLTFRRSVWFRFSEVDTQSHHEGSDFKKMSKNARIVQKISKKQNYSCYYFSIANTRTWHKCHNTCLTHNGILRMFQWRVMKVFDAHYNTAPMSPSNNILQHHIHISSIYIILKRV